MNILIELHSEEGFKTSMSKSIIIRSPGRLELDVSKLALKDNLNQAQHSINGGEYFCITSSTPKEKTS